jgi:hypothetical protein
MLISENFTSMIIHGRTKGTRYNLKTLNNELFFALFMLSSVWTTDDVRKQGFWHETKRVNVDVLPTLAMIYFHFVNFLR